MSASVRKPCLQIPTKPDCLCLHCAEWRDYQEVVTTPGPTGMVRPVEVVEVEQGPTRNEGEDRMTATKASIASGLASRANEVLDHFSSGLGRLDPRDLERLPDRSIIILGEMLSLLQRERQGVFEAFLEWMHEDPGGDTLANAIPNCIGYHDFLKAQAEEEPS